jgi:hypothetical protein
VKFDALVAVPAGVVTEMGPVFALFGTVAVIDVDEFTVNTAPLLPIFTVVAPVKFVPVIVTDVPTGPLWGVKLVMVGGDITVKSVLLVAVPPGVVTATRPVVAPEGTVARICIPFTVKLAAMPLNVTAVAPARLVPLMVTDVPTGPLVGVKLLIVGAGPAVTVNEDELVAVPPGVVTVSTPVVAPVGTVAVICVAELTVKIAVKPLNRTVVAPVRLLPVMTTDVPTGPLAGVTVVIVGAATTVNALALVTVPPGVVTEMGPVAAPVGTTATICVDELTT